MYALHISPELYLHMYSSFMRVVKLGTPEARFLITFVWIVGVCVVRVCVLCVYVCVRVCVHTCMHAFVSTLRLLMTSGKMWYDIDPV